MQGPPQSNIGNLFNNDGQFCDTPDGLRVTELSPSSPLPDDVEVIHGTVEEPENDDDDDMHVGLPAVRGSRVRKLIMVSRPPLLASARRRVLIVTQDVDADLVYILWYLLQLVNWFMVFVSATRVHRRV